MLIVLSILLIIALFLWLIIPLRSKYLKKQRQERIETISRLIPDINAAFSEIRSYFSYNHYITESEREALERKYVDLIKEVKEIIHCEELEGSPQKESIQRFYKAMTDTKAHKKANNEHFVQNELSRCADFLDNVLAYPLDAQQREAVVSLEDNVLVISSAGSGKTLTTVGKVRYLIDMQHVPAEKILLITFTRKAAEF